MAKKIRDEQGNLYVLKKPFYKRWWFILLAILVVFGAIGGDKGSKQSSATPEEASVAETTTVKEETTTKAPETTTAAKEETTSSSEEAGSEIVDVSDDALRSIKTYSDYLDRYGDVATDYINYYQSKIEKAGLNDAETLAEFEKSKAELQAELEAAEKEFGLLGDMPLPGGLHSTLAEMLIQQRDLLRSSVDTAFAPYGV